MSQQLHPDAEKKQVLLSLWYPSLFVIIIWTVKLIEHLAGISLTEYGLYPLRIKGLLGIFTSPLIHADWKHLFNNTFSLFCLSWAVFYFYREVAFKVFFLIYFISGFWIWFFARDAYHIGASGLIYGLGGFAFVSGVIRKNKNLLAISLLVAFLYGSMVWGIFPIEETISWESHLMGMLAGIILAFYFKEHGPPLPEAIEDEDDIEEFEDDPEKYFNDESNDSKANYL